MKGVRTKKSLKEFINLKEPTLQEDVISSFREHARVLKAYRTRTFVKEIDKDIKNQIQIIKIAASRRIVENFAKLSTSSNTIRMPGKIVNKDGSDGGWYDTPFFSDSNTILHISTSMTEGWPFPTVEGQTMYVRVKKIQSPVTNQEVQALDTNNIQELELVTGSPFLENSPVIYLSGDLYEYKDNDPEFLEDTAQNNEANDSKIFIFDRGGKKYRYTMNSCINTLSSLLYVSTGKDPAKFFSEMVYTYSFRNELDFDGEQFAGNNKISYTFYNKVTADKLRNRLENLQKIANNKSKEKNVTEKNSNKNKANGKKAADKRGDNDDDNRVTIGKQYVQGSILYLHASTMIKRNSEISIPLEVAKRHHYVDSQNTPRGDTFFISQFLKYLSCAKSTTGNPYGYTEGFGDDDKNMDTTSSVYKIHSEDVKKIDVNGIKSIDDLSGERPIKNLNSVN